MKFNNESVQRLLQKLHDLDYALQDMAAGSVEQAAKRIIEEINNMPWGENPAWTMAQATGEQIIGDSWIAPVEPLSEYGHGSELVGEAPDPYGAGEMPFTRIGELQESFYFAVAADAESAMATVYNTAPYAPMVELGTDLHPAYPFLWPPIDSLADNGDLLKIMADEMTRQWRTTVARIAK